MGFDGIGSRFFHMMEESHFLVFLGWKADGLTALAAEYEPAFEPDKRMKDAEASIAKKRENYLKEIELGTTPYLATVSDLVAEVLFVDRDDDAVGLVQTYRMPKGGSVIEFAEILFGARGVFTVDDELSSHVYYIGFDTNDFAAIMAAEVNTNPESTARVPLDLWRPHDLHIDPYHDLVPSTYRSSVSIDLLNRVYGINFPIPEGQKYVKHVDVDADKAIAMQLALRGGCLPESLLGRIQEILCAES